MALDDKPGWKTKKYFTAKHVTSHLRDPCSHEEEMNITTMIRGIVSLPASVLNRKKQEIYF